MPTTKPIFLGRYSPAYAGDVEDFAIDVSAMERPHVKPPPHTSKAA